MNSFVQPRTGGLVERARPVAAVYGIKVSVIMVVYRTGPALAESVHRVLADALVDEFVIVDNGSTPTEEAVLDAAAREPRVQLLRGQGNVGFARGANLGASAAHGRVLVFLNPDAFLQPGCIAAMTDTLGRGAAPKLVGARVLNLDGSEQRGARRGEVTPVTTLLSLTRISRRVPVFRGFEIHHEDDPTPQAPIPVPTISGACFAITRADFSAMGGFDEEYFLHVEDVDLCWRVRRSGGEVLFHPQAEVIHLGSTSRASPVKVEYWKGLGLARYFRKRADNRRRAVVAYLLAPLIMAVSVLRPLFKRPRPH
jgi:GT2 family glycosyltransferase